jgi:hypothetical protein
MMMNSGRIINRTMLERYFALLPGLTTEKIKSLLYPQDPQDVPRAVELLQTVIKLQDLEIPSATPAVAADLDAFRLLAELVEAILLPFTDTKASLSDQVKYLSKYAHLVFTLFRAHRDSLMSNQLYHQENTRLISRAM